MIKEEDIVEIGKFKKTHALKGELNAVIDVEPEYVGDGNPLVLDIDGIYVPFYAESLRPKGTTTYLIKLRGVDDVEDAEAMVNKKIYGLRKDLMEYFDTPEEEVVFDSDLIGFDVVDTEQGNLGVLKDLDDTTINTLMVIDSPKYGEIYVPYNEDFIETIAPEESKIIVKLPEGLVDLNEKKK